MTGVSWIRIGAVLGALSVAAGAFGAHGLRERMHLEPRLIETFETGARYQMYHALALVAVGVLLVTGRATGLANVAGWLFLVGVVMFSGSLYAIVLGVFPSKVLGPITPMGGLGLIVGWVLLALSVRNS
jgi:uncharacterized membrane protein YgdD (TMEM256/DUF423 family)